MRTLLRKVAVALVATLLASLSAAPAFAHGIGHNAPSFAASCHSASGLERSIAQMAADSGQSEQWNCSDKDWVAHQPVAWLLFTKDAWEGHDPPRYFFSRTARFQNISFAARDADGTIREVTWQENDARPFAAGPVFQLELPRVTDQTTELIVRIERPHSVPLLTEARLSSYPDDADWSQLEVLILAFVIGMLVLPLFFDISFYIVLRERFVLLHGVMVIAMMTYVLFAGGLISVFNTFPLVVLAVVSPLSWAVGVGVSALFLAEFLEEGAQSKVMRRATIAAGLWSMSVPAFFALQLHATHGLDDPLYFISFVPVIAIISFAIIEALWRGSRSARFIAVAWAPIIFASVERLMRGIGVYVGPSALDQGMYIATGVEVIIISLAIADRFLAIRGERDEAITEARMLEKLSEHDPLTGLMNRRGLEVRFAQLRADGFDTFALVDLDRFKQVNDEHGHQVGDAALVACAAALRGVDQEAVAVRMGGEEFVVLLRGEQSVQRAETLRRAIPARIASDVAGLSSPVTASMGVVELPADDNDMMSFDEFYARADALMYEAKEAGRNRMAFEKLTRFPMPQKSSSDLESSGGEGVGQRRRERKGKRRRSGRDRRVA